MKKDKIKDMLRKVTIDETRHAKHGKHINTADKTGPGVKDSDKPDYDNIVTLLQNDIYNHAGVMRRLTNEPWASNTEATNRSLFRKKLNKEKNDDGGEYLFSDETLSGIEAILMNLSATINHKIGHRGT